MNEVLTNISQRKSLHFDIFFFIVASSFKY